MRLATELGLIDEFQEVVKGFADSLLMARKLLPERKKEKKNYSVSGLALDYAPNFDMNELHNAQADVSILKNVLVAIGITEKLIKENALTIMDMQQNEKRKITEATNKLTFSKYNKVISDGMITKMAAAGINFSILQAAYEKNRISGIRFLLSENVDGKPRVTTNKKCLEKIFSIFETNKNTIEP